MVRTRSEKDVTRSEKDMPRKRRKINQSVNSMPNHMRCSCGGGQSCIVDRRWMGDWVHEDEVFHENNLPIRRSCYEPFSPEQELALYKIMNPD